MDWEREWERLNLYQREAVINENTACLVSANVGSGKTTVLTAKILYLHEVKHVSYRNIMVLTFTNRAAAEIRERLVSADRKLRDVSRRGSGASEKKASSGEPGIYEGLHGDGAG